MSMRKYFGGIRIMKWYHIVIILFFIFIFIVLLLFLIPLINALNGALIKNINLENNTTGWTGFYGNIIGAFLSGLITLIVFIFTMYINRKIEEKKRNESLMPYITIKCFVRLNDINGKIIETTYLTIKNIGLNSAVNITSNINFSPFDTRDKNDRFIIPPLAVNAEHEYLKDNVINKRNNIIEVVFNFSNLIGIEYTQKINLDNYGDTIKNITPQRIKSPI